MCASRHCGYMLVRLQLRPPIKGTISNQWYDIYVRAYIMHSHTHGARCTMPVNISRYNAVPPVSPLILHSPFSVLQEMFLVLPHSCVAHINLLDPAKTLRTPIAEHKHGALCTETRTGTGTGNR